MRSRSPDEPDDREWRFSVDEVGDDADDASDGGGSIFGPRPDEDTLEVVPGQPDPVNALFVALGAAVSVLLVLTLIGVV